VQEVIEPHDRPAEALTGDDEQDDSSRPDPHPDPPEDEATEELTTELDLLTAKKRERPSVSDAYPETDDEETSRELDLVI